MDCKKKNSDSQSPSEAKTLYSIADTAGMRVDFMFNREGGVWLMHDKPLPALLKWVEYDTAKETLTLVLGNGRLMDAGLRIPADRSFYLERAMEVTALLMRDGFVVDFATVPILSGRMSVN